MQLNEKEKMEKVSFYGGSFGALLPFVVFVTGVIIIALSGAPDERGFWPILILALGLGLILAKDKNAFSRTVIGGMSQEIVMIMITAWMLASIIGVLMTVTGFVEALSWVSSQLNLSAPGFVVATFIICCIVSLSTGSSFATILICSPILYPAGGLLGAHLPSLAGAIIAGATFGDFSAPISDTTIASALSQKAAIGPTVRSRLKYILPVAGVALVAFYISAGVFNESGTVEEAKVLGDPRGLPMLLVPALIIYLFLRGKHLLHGLMMGLLFGVVLGLVLGLLPVEKLLWLDLENFTAQSFVIDGINRAVGISFFTILLMGLVATLKASGLVDQLVAFASGRSKTAQHAESWIAGTVAGAVLLTTHSVVAILMVAEFANKTGRQMGVSPKRRANILSMVVCVFPFLLPYFIPVILMANTTLAGEEFGIPPVAPLEAGLYNFVAWGLIGMVLFVLFLGFGRKAD
jgi:Na+/H+ antiporter NhaC